MVTATQTWASRYQRNESEGCLTLRPQHRNPTGWERTRIQGYLGDLTNLAISLAPVLAILILVLVFKTTVSMSVGVVLASILVLERYSLKKLGKLLKEGFSLNIVLLVLGVMLFRDILAASGPLDAIPDFFRAIGVPPLILLFSLPFIVGFATGLPTAVPGITFPLLIGALSAKAPGGGLDMGLVAFAFASGFAGTLASPAHLCLILTIDYFKADFTKVHKALWIPSLSLVAAGLVISLLP